MNSVVITGATGAIGLALIEECIKRKIRVLALVNPNSNRKHKIPLDDCVTVVECSLEDYETFESYEVYDVFFHLAWMGTLGFEERNQVFFQEKNIKYSLDAVELARKLGCKTFVGAGSQAEFGRYDSDLSEILATKPETAYGVAKLCSGQLSRILCLRYGIKHIWARILSTYGPNSDYKTVLNYTLNELLMNRSPKLSEGIQIWDFIYVNDAARGLLCLAERGRDNEIYVLGSGECLPLREYLIVARESVENFVKRKLPSLDFGALPYNENSVMHLSCDINKIIQDTGFVPMTSFEDGIKKTIEWMVQDKKYNSKTI